MRSNGLLAAIGVIACVAASACSSSSGTTATGGDTGVNDGAEAGTQCTVDTDCAKDELCSSDGLCTPAPTGPTCQQCACELMVAEGGCANVCAMAKNGTSTPNFCDGVPALPMCLKCLQDSCGAISAPPDPTDPTSCL